MRSWKLNSYKLHNISGIQGGLGVKMLRKQAKSSMQGIACRRLRLQGIPATPQGQLYVKQALHMSENITNTNELQPAAKLQ